MQIFGILNLTPDSFSDNMPEPDKVLEKARLLFDMGADVVDIGAESTNPNSKVITIQEEIKRLKPYLKDIVDFAHSIQKRVSVDTYKPETAEFALNCGVDFINDVSCFKDHKMLEIMANSKAGYIFMHNLGVPSNKSITLDSSIDPITYLIDFYEKTIVEVLKYITKERLIFDPGIGFGKTKEQDLDIINRAEQLKKAIDIPILFGHSRKSFMTLFTNKPPAERDSETRIITSKLKEKGIDYVRVHMP